MAVALERFRPRFFGAMLGDGAQAIHGCSAEPPLQTLEQRLRALCEWFCLEQIGVPTLERPEYAALHLQSHGRDRQRAALQSILDQMQQSISIQRRLAQIEALDGRRPMQV